MYRSKMAPRGAVRCQLHSPLLLHCMHIPVPYRSIGLARLRAQRKEKLLARINRKGTCAGSCEIMSPKEERQAVPMLHSNLCNPSQPRPHGLNYIDKYHLAYGLTRLLKLVTTGKCQQFSKSFCVGVFLAFSLG